MPSAPIKPESHSIRALLKRIGLDERETDVYLALLPLKVARAAAICKAAKQSRSHTYMVLRSLEQKGLVSEMERGKILHFVAQSPQSLLSYVRDREEELKALQPLVEGAIPQLQGMTSPFIGEPRVTMLHGINGMKQIYRDILQNEFCGFFNPESMYKSFGRNVIQMVMGKNPHLRGRDLIVDTPMTRRYLSEVQQDEDYQIRILPPDVQFGTDTNVNNDTIALFAYDDEQTIILIENQNMADSFRAWFEVLWNVSAKTPRQ